MVAVITKKTKLNERDLLVMPFVGVAEKRRLRILFPDAYVVGFVGVLRSVYKRPDSSKAMTHSSSRILRFIISARSSMGDWYAGALSHKRCSTCCLMSLPRR